MSTTPAADRLPALDGLRGLAVLSVCFFHFGYAPYVAARAEGGGGADGLGRTRVGFLGVDLFFVLSGFLITGILLESRHDRRYFVNFYARRALRIAPVYFGFLAICLLALPFAGKRVFAPDVYEHQWVLWAYLANFAHLWGYELGDFGHFWSLAIEEHFYLVWPFAVMACPGRRLGWVCLALVVLGPVSRATLTAAGAEHGFVGQFSLSRFDQLAVGAALALAIRAPRARAWLSRHSRVGLAVLTPLAIAGAAAEKASGGWGWESGPLGGSYQLANAALATFGPTVYAGAAAAWVFTAISAVPGALARLVLESSVSRSWGRYSYAAYVFHLPLMRASGPIADRLGPELAESMIGPLVTTTVLLALTYASAWLSWHLYESRFLALKRFFPSRPAVAGDSSFSTRSGTTPASSPPVTSTGR